MCVDQVDDQMPPSATDVARRRPTEPAGAVPTQTSREELPGVVLADNGSTRSVEELLLSVASGNREAFVALESLVGGLVRVNIRRVLRDASRSDAVTQEFFDEVLRDASNFDPDRESAQAWLLTRAHLRAMDGLLSGHAAVRERIDVATTGTGPSDLGQMEDRDQPVPMAAAGSREVSPDDRTALLHF